VSQILTPAFVDAAGTSILGFLSLYGVISLIADVKRIVALRRHPRADQ
jgi:hypothetical protein